MLHTRENMTLRLGWWRCGDVIPYARHGLQRGLTAPIMTFFR
jgi:hypothetical protein